MSKYFYFDVNEADEIWRFFTVANLSQFEDFNGAADDAFKTELVRQDVVLPEWAFGGKTRNCIVWQNVNSRKRLAVLLEISGT